MKAKKLITAMSSIFMAGLALTTAGCGGGGSTAGDINTLEIFCVDAGYGVEWVDDMVALFKQQAWVQEKYPELVVTVSSNDDQTFAQSFLNMLSRACSYVGFPIRAYTRKASVMYAFVKSFSICSPL